ncbi:MAG: hypothetical protein R3A46_03800 [Thermomicrobiales bacterium]
MTSPASAQFPWSEVPEPPSGEFRSGKLPAGIGGDYLAARGSRPGPALLISVDARSGYAAVHGVFRLAAVLDARRLSGSLLVQVGGRGADISDLLESSDALIVFEHLRPEWQELAAAGYERAGNSAADRLASEMAANSGLRYRYGGPAPGWLTGLSNPERAAVSLRVPGSVDGRPEAVESVFQGLINMLRVAGMLEGQLAPVDSVELQPPAFARAPVSGYWSPAARPGQHIRTNDKLGSFLDAQGNELGDLLTNISGTLLGISAEVRVEEGQPLAELSRPLG